MVRSDGGTGAGQERGVEDLYCNNCGHRNPEGANFCSSCGAVLEGPGDDVTITFFPTEPTDPTQPTAEPAAEAERPLEPLQLQVGTAALVVRRGPAAGSRYLLDEPVTSLGRHPDSTIFLDDVTVSRRHAEVVRSEDGYEVRDQGFTDEFIRTWEFYLAFCEAGFRTRALGDLQMVISRPYNGTLPQWPEERLAL